MHGYLLDQLTPLSFNPLLAFEIPQVNLFISQLSVLYLSSLPMCLLLSRKRAESVVLSPVEAEAQYSAEVQYFEVKT